MQATKVIGKKELRVWRTRWKQLSVAGFRNDYAIAGLSAEIRSEFPDNEDGDATYVAFVNQNISGAQGTNMLRMTVAHGLFTESQWGDLGGWRGIRFLSALTARERTTVIRALMKKPGPHHYTTIRHKAHDLGIRSRLKGRDTRSRSEARAQTLQSFVVKLYSRKGIKGLPPLPQRVKDALTLSTRAKLVGANAIAN